jgi:2'-5' RNA ligase
VSHSVLLVPIPELDPFVRSRTEHYDTDWLSADPMFVHAHVTALGPFLPRDALDASAVASIGRIASQTRPFEFKLSIIGTFPNGIIHLVPEPEGPFRTLTARLWEAFPDYPPYAGEFGDVRPHLTLDARSEDVSEASTRALLGDLVPATCHAERLDLAWYEAGNCRLVRSWPLG